MDVIRTLVIAASVTLIVQSSGKSQPPRDAETVPPEVRVLIDGGRYAEAESAARARLAFFGGLSQQNTIEVNRAGDLLIEALARNGRGAEAETRTLAEEMVRRREATSGGDSAVLGTALRNLGDVLFQAGYYREAVPTFDRARRLHEQTVAGNLELASDLDYLALALLQVGRYDEALEVSSRALAIKRDLLSDTDLAIARTHEILARVRQRKGDYAGARLDLERALAMREAREPRHPDVATTLMLLGTQLVVEGEFMKSQQLLERGLSLAQATLRADHPDIALLVRTLAIPVKSLGDLQRARALRERAISIAEISLGPEHPSLADCLNDLAVLLFSQAEYVAARPLYERAATIYERRLGPDYPGIATVVFNLALLNAKLGDFTHASALHRRAVASWQRLLGAEHPIVARASQEFGQTLAEQGLHREALPLFERALAIRERTLGRDHTSVAETLSFLADSLARQGQLRRSLDLSQRAMQIWVTSKAPETAATFPESLVVHAGVLSANGDLAGAVRAYERVQEIRVPLLGESHPAVAEVKASLAAVKAQIGQQREALAQALEAEDVGRRHLSLMLASLPERQALNYALKRPEGLSLALSLINDRAREGSVLDALIRGRSLVLDEIASRHRALSDESASLLAPLWISLTSARQRLANLTIQGPGRHPGQYAALLEEAQRQKEDAERALAEQSAAFRAERSRRDVGLDQVRAHLPPSSALVSFVRYDRSVFSQKGRPTVGGQLTEPEHSVRTVPSYLAFVLRADASDPVLVPLGPAATIDALVANWRQEMIADITSPGTQRSGPSFHSLGTTLRRRIWDPIATNLGDAQRIFIVPDGTLNLVPLAALPLDRGQYLLEGGRIIHYLSAERDLVTDDSPAVPTGSGLLAVGGPAFDDASSFRAALESKATVGTGSDSDSNNTPETLKATRMKSLLGQDTAFRGPPTNCLSFRSMNFKALPGSRIEANRVTAVWQQFALDAAQADLALTGAEATEFAVKRSGPGRRVLHIGTHGFFLGDRCAPTVDGTRAVGGLTSSGSKTVLGPTRAKATPHRESLPENPLLLSGLALAGANRRAAARSDEDDGILTAEEVASLNLTSVEWAVLSACDTGLGTVASGEGVLGLRRAFQIAGARTVIMSLWSIDDRAARQWMEALYRARLERHLDTANAMREASVSFIRDRRLKGQSTHPFYWASFVAAGDWR